MMLTFDVNVYVPLCVGEKFRDFISARCLNGVPFEHPLLLVLKVQVPFFLFTFDLAAPQETVHLPIGDALAECKYGAIEINKPTSKNNALDSIQFSIVLELWAPKSKPFDLVRFDMRVRRDKINRYSHLFTAEFATYCLSIPTHQTAVADFVHYPAIATFMFARSNLILA